MANSAREIGPHTSGLRSRETMCGYSTDRRARTDRTAPVDLGAARRACDQRRRPVDPVGVLDFYRVIAETAVDAVRRYRLGMWAEIALSAVYFGLRTIEANGTPDGHLALAVVALCFLSPASGLVVLAAIAPFNEGIDGSRSATRSARRRSSRRAAARDRAALARRPVGTDAALGAGRARRCCSLVDGRPRPDPDPRSLGHRLRDARCRHVDPRASRRCWWSSSATVWIARSGARGPLVAALTATTVAGPPEPGRLLGRRRDPGRASSAGSPPASSSPSRLTGVIRSPTSTAALVMLPALRLPGGGVPRARRPPPAGRGRPRRRRCCWPPI